MILATQQFEAFLRVFLLLLFYNPRAVFTGWQATLATLLDFIFQWVKSAEGAHIFLSCWD